MGHARHGEIEAVRTEAVAWVARQLGWERRLDALRRGKEHAGDRNVVALRRTTPRPSGSGKALATAR